MHVMEEATAVLHLIQTTVVLDSKARLGTVHLISLILFPSFFVIDGSVAVGFPSTTDPSYRLPPISKSMIPMVAVYFIQ